MPQRLRIFISSPGDVPDERLRAALVIDKLAQDYGRFFAIESYRWEHEPLLASGQFQDAIEPPSAFDIVILILWSRLGTPLPEKTAMRSYRGIDDRAPVTGTEWEYEEALKAARNRNAPDMLAFRNIRPAPVDPLDPAARARSNAQLDALDAFWRRHFADRGIFLAAYDQYGSLEEFATRLEESLRKLVERRVQDQASHATGETPAIYLGAPFRGLESYEFEHAAIFFGRDALVARAAEQLAANARDGTAFLLVCAASGSGKSSLVKAALVPRLMKPQRIEGMGFLRRAVFRPAAAAGDVILGLVDSLTAAAAAGTGLPELLAPGQTAAELAAHLRATAEAPGFVFAAALARVTEAARRSGDLLAFEDAKLILVVDQLEELFTVDAIPAADRRLFTRLLGGLARSGAVWVIATLRADFWHIAAADPELTALAAGNARLDVPPPSAAELAEMIRKPAQAAGLAFEVHPQSGLELNAVLAEEAAAQPGVLPLLSFTLDELYAQDIVRGGGHVLTYATYEALGRLEGAITTRAETVVGALPGPAEAALPRVLRALATAPSGGDSATAVSRAAPLTDFPAGSAARQAVDALTAARLLVASGDGEAATLHLAHEALIARWPRARDQLARDRRDLEIRALVERQERRWHALAAGAGERTRRQLLLRDPDLAAAVDLDRRWNDELAADLRAFIARSHAARRAAARRRWTVAIGVIVVFAGLAAGFAQSYYAAERARRDLVRATAKWDVVRAAVDSPKNGHNTIPITPELMAFIDGAVEQKIPPKRILWLDLHPDNNTSETAAFNKMGLRVDAVTTIGDALARSAQPYDAIITHYGRNAAGPGRSNADELKGELGSAGRTDTPIIIYSREVTTEQACRARADGFYDETDLPSELFAFVLNAVQGRPARPQCPAK